MGIVLEYKKIKRTGIAPGCLIGGVLAAVIPILELAVRSERYTALMQPPLRTIFQADWQMMTMLNMLLIITAACMMYHTEYADNAFQRMTTLPLREETIFIRKVILLSGISLAVLVIEMFSLIFCTLHWFAGEGGAYTVFYGSSSAGAYMEFLKDLFADLGYCFCMLQPLVVLALLIASACRNMWISLGIDVVCVFAATMIPAKCFVLSLFPFAMPFQILEGTDVKRAAGFLIAAAAEILVITAAEMVFLALRRSVT